MVFFSKKEVQSPCASWSVFLNDKEGNDRLSWPRFNTSTYKEKVRARNAKSRANFSILHSQTPSADRFVPTSMIES